MEWLTTTHSNPAKSARHGNSSRAEPGGVMTSPQISCYPPFLATPVQLSPTNSAASIWSSKHTHAHPGANHSIDKPSTTRQPLITTATPAARTLTVCLITQQNTPTK
jgi:hypothetical protein